MKNTTASKCPALRETLARSTTGYEQTLLTIENGWSDLLPAVVATLALLGIAWPYAPGQDEQFWRGAVGQEIAGAIYAHLTPGAFVAPSEASRAIYPGHRRPDARLLAAVRDHEVQAWPLPDTAKHRSAKTHARQRKSTPRIKWGVLRKDIDLAKG